MKEAIEEMQPAPKETEATLRSKLSAAKAKVARIIACFLFAVMSADADVGVGATWDRYAPGSISAVVDDQKQHVCEGSGPEDRIWTIAGDDHARTAIMVYNGRSRPLQGPRRELLTRWLTAFDLPLSVGEVFESEYLFHEGERAYWLPVQGPVSAYFSDELEPNDPALLYVSMAGALCVENRVTWLFLVNGFQAIDYEVAHGESVRKLPNCAASVRSRTDPQSSSEVAAAAGQCRGYRPTPAQPGGR